MPELPEVETTIRYLKNELLGNEITDLTASHKGESHFNLPLSQIKSSLIGQRLENLTRRGKWMLFDFGGIKAVGHLRMSGRYKIDTQVDEGAHNRFQLHFATGKIANYIDQRRFGTFHLIDDFSRHPTLASLGPDALNDHISENYLLEKFRKLNKSIYQALLDQNIIAGLGNIYVNEILHTLGVHPLLPANKLSKEKISELISEIPRLLELSLSLKGTTLADNLYQDPEGKTGEFAKLLKVYGKKDSTEITRIKIGGRSVFVHRNTKLPH